MDQDSLQRLAGQHRIPIGTLEKDYAVTILLSKISQFPNISSMTFKGGTALKKIYYPEARFSEDLDFTCSSDISQDLANMLEKTIKDKLDVNFTEVKEIDTTENSRKYSVKYLDFNNYSNSVKIDLSLREKVLTDITERQVKHIYELDNGTFNIPAMQISEIMAEKVRAIIYARKPRHLYDMNYLFAKDVKLDPKLVNSKLEYYGKPFDIEKLKESIYGMKKEWSTDLKPLLPTVPFFDSVAEKVIANVTNAMKQSSSKA